MYKLNLIPYEHITKVLNFELLLKHKIQEYTLQFGSDKFVLVFCLGKYVKIGRDS